MQISIQTNKGFTLIELVVAILLIGILAIAITPRIDIDPFRDDTEASLFLSHLRYTQHRSMVTGGGWSLTFASTSYTLRDETGTAQMFPDGKSTINVNAITSTRSPLYFDYLGTPDDDANSNNSNGVSTRTTINIGGQTIIIEPNTGGVL